MKSEILKMLEEAGDYISGQTLSEIFGVSRTAIWKAIQQLISEGYDIEAVRNRGYLLKKGERADQKEIYSRTSIQTALDTEWLGKDLIFLKETDSTNTALRKLAENGAPEGTVIVADEQTAGRGRRGRSWVSEPGSGIFMSFLLRPEFPPQRASMLTLAAAMAVADGIYEVTGLDCEIKWPNDVIFSGRKLCGILTEMSTDMDTISYVIVGIGINVSQSEFPDEIKDTAASLASCCAGPVSRVGLIVSILKAWERLYSRFLMTDDLIYLRSDYQRRLINVGRDVKVLSESGDYVGISRGITRDGELIVETPDGKEHRVTSGEVSVRGVYGYV